MKIEITTKWYTFRMVDDHEWIVYNSLHQPNERYVGTFYLKKKEDIKKLESECGGLHPKFIMWLKHIKKFKYWD